MKYYFSRFLFYCVTLSPLYSNATDEILVYVEQLDPYVVIHKNDISGATIDILNEALINSDVAIDFQGIIWSRALYESKHKPNIVLTGLNRTAPREDNFHWLFKLPIPPNKRRIFLWHLKVNSAENKKIDIKNASVAVMLDDHKGKYYKDYMEVLGYQANLYSVGSREQVIQLLFKGRIDYILGGELNNPWRVTALGYDPEMIERGIEIPNTSKGLFIAISKYTDIKLVNKIRTALDDLVKSGRVNEIMSKWLKNDEKTSLSESDSAVIDSTVIDSTVIDSAVIDIAVIDH